jgi:putative Ca2+/H+ antiporter (TMEM165/GDT1 family)
MNFTATIIVFRALFLAELGDKTQLALISFVASGMSPVNVLVGGALGLVAAAAAAVLVGDTLLRVVPATYLQLGAAALFLVVGVVVGTEALRDLAG